MSNSIDKILALDLSFTSTGVSVVDFFQKSIFTRSIKIGCKVKSFTGIQCSISQIIDEIESEVIKNNITTIVMEEPFPCSIFSSGLYGLDSAVYQHFKKSIIMTYHPNTLKKLHGGKYSKKDSITLATSIISKLCNNGFDFINESTINKNEHKDLFGNKTTKDFHYKITHDECEAFLYAIYTAVLNNNVVLKNIEELIPITNLWCEKQK